MSNLLGEADPQASDLKRHWKLKVEQPYKESLASIEWKRKYEAEKDEELTEKMKTASLGGQHGVPCAVSKHAMTQHAKGKFVPKQPAYPPPAWLSNSNTGIWQCF